MPNQLTYKLFGNRAILIEWPAEINEEILTDILLYKNKIIACKEQDIEECISGYNSLTIIYSLAIRDFELEKGALKSLYYQESVAIQNTISLWKVPVCYDTQLGIDMEEISQTLKLSVQEVIDLHSQTIYTVYFIGFLPGFLYLGGLDKRLEFKRKSDPRLHVDKGSVAIGGAQTGVYPMDSAGGWNIIGKTPLHFFNPKNNTPCFAKPGDKIQFVPIKLKEYNQLADIGTYLQPSKIEWND